MVRLPSNKQKSSTYQHALERTVRRALKAAPQFADGGAGAVVLVAPEDYDLSDYGEILTRIVSTNNEDFYRSDSGLLYLWASDSEAKVLKSFDKEFQSNHRVIVITETRQNLPALIKVATDAVIDLQAITPQDFRAACKVVLKLRMSLRQARQAFRFPSELVWAALRPGRAMDEVLSRLEHASDHLQRPHPAVPPTLSKMHGYGEAKAWGLQLAGDLKDWRNGSIAWSDIDSGILLSGPPGVGKTVFARALAHECGVSLVATSLGQWQSKGHLGDLLKAMRTDFAKARQLSPSIIFVDEMDSFGDRSTFRSDNADYSIQVVNALLECLDGLGDREGVIVVGATNHPSRIDPAIVRSGRLDHHVAIPVPSADDRVQILAQLASCTVPSALIQPIKLATEGMTGADLAKAVRAGRRAARKNRRQFEMADIIPFLPTTVPVEGEFRRMAAVHEAGHTVVGLALGCGEYLGTVVPHHVVAGSTETTFGIAHFRFPEFEKRDRQAYLDRIAITLGGIAAEELWLGSFGDGGGGGKSSDLAVATRLATLMETSLGMGSTLRYSEAFNDKELEALRRCNSRLRQRIDATLAEQFARAKTILEGRQVSASKFISELVSTGFLTPEIQEHAVESSNIEVTVYS